MTQMPIRHLISIKDLTSQELEALVNKAQYYKTIFKNGDPNDFQANHIKLLGKTVALIFSKRSTRTRVSTEGAASFFGAQPMFLGKDNIQLGVNESLYDTVKVVSSMVSCIFARVNSHEEIQSLAKFSNVPIINSLCDTYHPLQAICDMLTIKEQFTDDLTNVKVGWIGDSNNVINDMLIACLKLKMNVSVAIPEGIEMNSDIIHAASQVSEENETSFEVTHDPKITAKDANILVTDTFISMGEEKEKETKLNQFKGFQINSELAYMADANFKFMHCLPRHKEEVTDDVFYSPNSIVFEQAENRLYAAMAAIDIFVINKGNFNA
ncbi:hypothetical protein KAFR_0A01490 [Kazachstania africana CBS 2517]|uniref:ornithine carbamoyltransferase n=1 Tax=Kazachstania africana (strain ATCC 22294 / BCRC 22015 / CBS 2517 / CECT 1963 / NBRC 1671 / NRRL Y-8276) TaxID=1071382 RepID=H2AMI7_KAZAF|nr:hypothetical protein KAFR_0A01490 [Kazachstania africana CBS 2517]CCF55587.1 hypothetical protein KAFR_0A01490 [Kazachstania africana CBS 2517]